MDCEELSHFIKTYKNDNAAKGLDEISIAVVILRFLEDTRGGNTMDEIFHLSEHIDLKLEARRRKALKDIKTEAKQWIMDVFWDSYLDSHDIEIEEDDWEFFLKHLPDDFMVKIIKRLKSRGVDIYYTNYQKYYSEVMPEVYKLYKKMQRGG